MPAPKTPNTSAATEASVAARRHARYERMAEELRKAGYIVERLDRPRTAATIRPRQR